MESLSGKCVLKGVLNKEKKEFDWDEEKKESQNKIDVASGNAVRKSALAVGTGDLGKSMRRVVLFQPSDIQACNSLSTVQWFYMVNKFILISFSGKRIFLF